MALATLTLAVDPPLQQAQVTTLMPSPHQRTPSPLAQQLLSPLQQQASMPSILVAPVLRRLPLLLLLLHPLWQARRWALMTLTLEAPPPPPRTTTTTTLSLVLLRLHPLLLLQRQATRSICSIEWEARVCVCVCRKGKEGSP